jgi:tetratricopeptide (TPR) repeat protein
MRTEGPELPEDVQIGQLDRAVRGRLRGLSKDNAEVVGRHLVMTGRLLDSDPELAYAHAQAAVRRAGRIDVVREAAGLSAYRLGNYAEALRELRTVRRLNGSSEHLPVMADSERGLGRPERAIALAQSAEAETLDAIGRVELAIVVSGARVDLGEIDAARAVLDTLDLALVSPDQRRRVQEARLTLLEAAGMSSEADRLRAALGSQPRDVDPADEVVVFDVTEGAEGTGGAESAEGVEGVDGTDDGATPDAQTADPNSEVEDAAGVEGDVR